MSTTIYLGIAAIVAALFLRAQTHSFPEVAQRLPVLLIWLIVGLSVLMIGEELYKRHKARRSPSEPSSDAKASDAKAAVKWPVLLSFGAAIVAYVTLIPIAGYLVITPLFIGGALMISRNMRAVTAISVALGTTLFMWVVFVWALNLPLKLLPFSN